MSAPERPRILIVDDEEAILETLTFTFEDDYEVHTAGDARRALDILDASGPFAVVLTDQRMPNMTGVEFLARVYERHPATTRIILTGFADMDAIVKAINDGHVYAYIPKPWEHEQLKQVVRRAAELNALTCENQRLLTDLRSSKVLLEAVMDRLGMGAIGVDPAGLVQAVNRPARAFLGIVGDPRHRRFADVLREAGAESVGAAALRLAGGKKERYEEVEVGSGARRLRLRLSVEELAAADGERLGSVVLFREISHEPLRREFEDLAGEITRSEAPLRPRLESAVEALRRILDGVRRSGIDSPGMAELGERCGGALTAIENWLAVDDAMAAEAYPDAQLLQDRLRVARARWPFADELPARVRELGRRVEAYYESGENQKQRTL
ncbi:MAG TPA: response regulator [Myxococcota bacterium]|nr:response regulator [Myxococcota bacterium]